MFRIIGILVILFFVGCATNKPEVAQPVATGELFSLDEVVSDGQKFQVLQSESGLAVLPRRSDVSIQFGANAFMHVFFNEATLKPERIVLEPMQRANQPGESVYDLNADGMPDTREIEGRKQAQLYYKGGWYDYEEKKGHYLISYQGKPLELVFESEGWSRIVEKKKSSKQKSKPR